MDKKLSEKQKLNNLIREYQKLLGFLYEEHRDIYDDYVSMLKTPKGDQFVP